MYLDFLGHHHFQSNKLNYKYADLINSALKKETISEEDANNLIRTLNDKGLNHIYMSDHIVYPFLIDSLATDEEITKSTLILMPQLRDRMRSELDTLEPSKRELEALGPIQNEIRSEEDLMRAISFLEYSRTYQPLEQINCLGDIQYLFSKSPNSPYLSTFEKNQSKVEKFIKKEETNKLHELVSDKNLSEEKAKEMALEWSNQRGRVYQKLLYSCQARGASLQRSATNKRFFQTVLGLELTISTGAYLVVHKDDEKNSDWYKKLTAEILLKLAVAAARSGITTMTSGEWYKKAIQDYVLGAVNDVGPTLGYSAAFSPSQKELKERLDQLFEDPLFKEKMKELEFIMKKEGLLDKHKVKIKNDNGEFVTIDELKNNQEAKDLLTEALAREIYEKKEGDWIQTGNVGLDRYTYNRLWGVQSSARNMLVNLMIYKVLCTGDINPKEAYLTAIGIYSANKLISEPLYQSLREKAINQ